ncbi:MULTISPECIES: DUF1542 domain-containing protein, partial [unclassified Granulicatella]
EAKANVDNATTNAEVDTAKTDGTTAINEVNPNADSKNAAKAAIDTAAETKKSAIDNRKDLTDEEKDAAKKDVDD